MGQSTSDTSDKMHRMKELVQNLQQASKAYYNEDKEIMSNLEYDALYDELVQLEKETGVTLSGSPTVTVGYEVLSELKKVTHEYPMLSLDKTKEVLELASWLSSQTGVLSWKLDGLTTVLTYENGVLKQAVTRGNGQVGEDITHNAKVFQNVPQAISYKGKLIVRGESVIKYSDFKRINEEIADIDAKYKNPRNLCSGTVRQLNSEICASRNVHFFAFQLVDVGEFTELSTMKQRFEWLASLGFDVVEYRVVSEDTIRTVIDDFAQRVVKNDFPSDGLVLSYDDIAYGKSLGTTAKFPKDSIAFKWRDEVAETTFREVFWSASRTGLINPVAVFDPVEIEGTTVTRASLHNVSILEEYELGEGDRITVFKANMIIPQLADNLTRSNTLKLPECCPVCHQKTSIKSENDIRVLICPNPLCPAKRVKQFAHYVSRDAMNIEGLSEATLEKFIQNGFLHHLYDLYHLDNYEEEITTLEGFGQRSYNKLMKAIDKSRECSMAAFIYSLGIANIGLSNAKLLVKHFDYDFERLKRASLEELVEIDGIGELIAKSFVDFFAREDYNQTVDCLLKEIRFEQTEVLEKDALLFDGMTFVVTGSLSIYENRNAIKAEIERLGGKVAGSVSSKTSYLINNDITSNSSKNKKAKQLSIPIITEEDYVKLLQEGSN